MSMKRSVGKGTWDTLFWLSWIVLAVWLWVPDYLPAGASDVQSLVKMAAPNPEAKKVLADAFKETPNPNRGELRHMRSRVNELIVTETAREVTGDKTLKTPAEVQAMHEQEESPTQAQIEAKPWGEMSNDERAQFIVGKWQFGVFVLFLAAAALFGWRTMSVAHHGY